MSSMSSTITRNIQGVEGIINHRFIKPDLICEALLTAGTHLPGITYNNDGNKNLALVGDAVLKLVLVQYGYDKRLYKGAISNILTAKASNAYLTEKGRLNNLAQFIINNGAQNSVSNGPMATTVEAILGAVYLDSDKDISVVQGVMRTLDLFDPETEVNI